MIALYYKQVRFCCLLVLLLLALVAQRSCDRLAVSHPVCSVSALVPAAHAAGLPACVVFRPVVHRLYRYRPVRDTSRTGGASLQRKALPRCRWQGGYLVYPLPRRPRQLVLDSAAAAARRPAT